MANTTRIGVLKDALIDGLLSYAPVVAGKVQVMSADPGADRAAKDAIWFIGEDLIEQEWSDIGAYGRDEQITLVGTTFARRPGKGEAAIRAARTAAVALVAIVEQYLYDNKTAGGTVKGARCRPADLAEFVDPKGRVALVRFEILTEKTRLRPEE
jgi:hypothetical protein